MKRTGYFFFTLTLFGVMLVYIGVTTDLSSEDAFLFTQGADFSDVRNLDTLGLNNMELDFSDVIFETQGNTVSRDEIFREGCASGDISWTAVGDSLMTCDTSVLFEKISDTYETAFIEPVLDQRVYKGTFIEGTVLSFGEENEGKILSLDGYLLSTTGVPSYIVSISVSHVATTYEIKRLSSVGVSTIYQKSLDVSIGSRISLGLSKQGTVIFGYGSNVLDTQISLPGEMIIGMKGYQEEIGLTGLGFGRF